MKEFDWYLENEQKLLHRYPGRHIVIKDQQVIADYDSDVVAWRTTLKHHKPGTFIIHHCVPMKIVRVLHTTNCKA